MRPFKRLPAPGFLAENWEKWGKEYEAKKMANPSYTFAWKQYQKQLVNQRLQPDLRLQTQHHCSYCDAYPPNLPDKTIDHFKPKGDSRFYHLAYQWENLYFACGHCQLAKMERFNDALLHPDESGYSFERYFTFNFLTGEIEVYKNASPEDRRRAVVTIDILGFNLEGRPFARLHWSEFYQTHTQPVDLENFAFRFLFD